MKVKELVEWENRSEYSANIGLAKAAANRRAEEKKETPEEQMARAKRYKEYQKKKKPESKAIKRGFLGSLLGR